MGTVIPQICCCLEVINYFGDGRLETIQIDVVNRGEEIKSRRRRRRRRRWKNVPQGRSLNGN